ncbi:PREDICTED: alpha-1-macroglobulin-like [Priapulus caudatus]|uniref:Alpha-1-macroglobulin-like n=1 Tax=Priapulus caudatus TaxID=37621 RepID=A0ABM1EAM8_PRICU|nr:PREDICTED: alpha-1-macroglobulin-like [Priapulus caudatus]
MGTAALSQFASLSHGSGGVRTDVTIAEGGATDAVVHVTNDNSLVLQQIDVAAVPARVEVTATGSRCAIIQGNVFYNVFVEKRRVVTFQATIASRPQGAECKAWTINACGIYSGEEDSNMAVISIKMVSGFSPIKATLKKIFEKLDPNSPLKRYEVNGKSVDIYVNKFTPGEPICVTFDIEKYLDVEDAKPSTVRVYDYYEPEEAVSILYNIGECN